VRVVPEGGCSPLHFLLSSLCPFSRFIHTGNWAPDHKATVSKLCRKHDLKGDQIVEITSKDEDNVHRGLRYLPCQAVPFFNLDRVQ
jgi:hypothetical protein